MISGDEKEGEMIHVLYVGDYFLQQTTWIKGVEPISLFTSVGHDGRFIEDALHQDESIQVEYMSGPQAFESFPRAYEELRKFNVLILSDVGKDTLVLYPDFKPGPNRLKIMRQYVEKGGGLAYCGGWLSFQGYHGNGGWYGTPVAEVLPVEVLSVPDDRVELPEGEKPHVEDRAHPIFEGIPAQDFPRVYGYNRTKMKAGCRLLASIEESSPLIAVGEFGEGRTLVYASDPAPGWGMNFVKWDYYSKFWIQVVNWLVRKK